MVIKKCLRCGEKFKTYLSRVKVGKGKYCSKKCYWNSTFRNCLICNERFKVPSNSLKKGIGKFCSRKCYGISIKGKKHSAEVKKKISTSLIGLNTWSKGRKHSPETIRKRVLQMQGVKHWNWKGDSVGYYALHDWIKRNLGKPTKCEHCEKDGLTGHSIHWASISHEYKRDLSDWVRLCVPCHSKFDRRRKLLLLN